MYELLSAPETPGYIPPQAPEVCNGFFNGFSTAFQRLFQHLLS
jgi:hypothetical protein